MKRRFAWLLAVLLMLALLCACAGGKAETTGSYTVGSYTVTPLNEKSGTITDGINTYSYSYRYSTSGSEYSVTFTYPDGETYTWTENGNTGSGSTSLNFDLGKYPSGMVLNDVLARTRPAEQKEKPVAVILVLLVIGVLNTAWPKGAWYLEIGWKLRDAEPSDAALGWNRAVGVLALLVAVILILA